MAKAIPNGYHAITPSLTFKNSEKAIEFYRRAFNAKVLDIVRNPAGEGTMHAAVQIGDSILMMGDEIGGENCSRSAETIGASPIGLYLYVPDVDAVFAQAVKAGGVVNMPVGDMFWGDRVGQVVDPFGYSWMIATHKQDLNNDEIRKGAEAFCARMSKR